MVKLPEEPHFHPLCESLFCPPLPVLSAINARSWGKVQCQLLPWMGSSTQGCSARPPPGERAAQDVLGRHTVPAFSLPISRQADCANSTVPTAHCTQKPSGRGTPVSRHTHTHTHTHSHGVQDLMGVPCQGTGLGFTFRQPQKPPLRASECSCWLARLQALPPVGPSTEPGPKFQSQISVLPVDY